MANKLSTLGQVALLPRLIRGNESFCRLYGLWFGLCKAFSDCADLIQPFGAADWFYIVRVNDDYRDPNLILQYNTINSYFKGCFHNMVVLLKLPVLRSKPQIKLIVTAILISWFPPHIIVTVKMNFQYQKSTSLFNCIFLHARGQ